MNDDRFVTFGWRVGSIDDLALQVEQGLGISLEPRDSLYWGEYYNWRGDGPGESHIMLQSNSIEDDGERRDNQYPDHVLVLYGTDLPRAWPETIARIEGAELLDRR